jgi:hypothetical protein
MAVAVWVCVWVFDSIATGLHAYFCASIMLFLLLCSIVYFEIRYCDKSSIALFALDCFDYLRSPRVHSTHPTLM